MTAMGHRRWEYYEYGTTLNLLDRRYQVRTYVFVGERTRHRKETMSSTRSYVPRTRHSVYRWAAAEVECGVH